MMDGVDRKMRNYMTTLVQTESAHLSEMAMDKSIKEMGGDSWEWCATLEIHTCEHCGELDGQVFYYKNDKTILIYRFILIADVLSYRLMIYLF